MIEAQSELKCPAYITGDAREWWERMVEIYELEAEPHSVELLNMAAMQKLRAEQYREMQADSGPMVRDRFGQLKENPAAVGERSAINLFRLLQRELGILPGEPDNNRPPRAGSR